MFRAVFAHDVNFDPKSFDVVTDRSNLRKLLSKVTQESCKPFRVDIELVGKTLLFTRWERHTEEYIHITQSRGYGHEFEKAFTVQESMGLCHASSAHHRIIQYMFGGLKMLIRFEVDVHFAGFQPCPQATSDDDINDLSAAIKAVKLDSEVPRTLVSDTGSTSDLKLVLKGEDVSHDSLIEIKTRRTKRNIQTKDLAPQLFIGQVPHLIVACHDDGEFQTVKSTHVAMPGGFLDQFEMNNEEELKKLIKLLDTIKNEVRLVKGRRGILLCKEGSFALYESSKARHALPDDLLAKWE